MGYKAGYCNVYVTFHNHFRDMYGLPLTKVQALQAYCPLSILPIKRHPSQYGQCLLKVPFHLPGAKIGSNLRISV